MKQISLLFLLSFLIVGCQNQQQIKSHIYTTDIDHFWNAYDQIAMTEDTAKQYQLLKELFFDKGSLGLEGMMLAKNYTAQEYLAAINKYPKFWNSVRANTFKSKMLVEELDKGIAKLRSIYPKLKSAKIYFTIGALRSGGTTLDSLVLIGSELAMADKNTITSEFPEQTRAARRKYFDSNPIDDLVLLNVHEYVHTQQKPIVHNLLSQCLYEGVAEFVSTKAMGLPSSTPAINFGKENEDVVRHKFEKDLFRGDKTYEWLWSDRDNGFGVRDLGYYVGYEICERYFQKTSDQSVAIQTMIELDYTNEKEIEQFVDGTHFLSASLGDLYDNYEANRPKVIAIKEFENGSQEVSPQTKEITFEFSKPLDTRFKSTGFGDLGKVHFPQVNEIEFLEEGKSLRYKVSLEPNKRYQLLLEDGYRTRMDIPLKPYLIDFRTAEK